VLTPKLSKLRADKSGPINTALFNFLENLLVFRTMKELSVPAESGVVFRITRQKGETGICLLLHVDEQLFPIVEKDVPRPDYLALYLHGDGCLCTIIEMKSTAGKNLKHGLDQIKTFADRLQKEFREHLPRGFRLHVQGILLCPFNADVPRILIEKMAAGGLTILPAQYDHRAELFPYISKKNDLKKHDPKKERYKHEARSPDTPSPVEKMMSQDTLRRRVPDELTKKRPGDGAGQGLHINFALSDTEYAVLMTEGKRCVFVVCENSDTYLRKLQADIEAQGLEGKFAVLPMSEAGASR